MLMDQVMRVDGVAMGVNYGCNKVRFPAPVPVDSNVRLGARLTEANRVEGGAQYIVELSFETEGSDKPSCVAECIYRVYA
jgi:acyl dehydratase